MHDQKFAVDEADIDLDAVGAHLDRTPDGSQGILRFVAGGATVADAEETGRGKTDG
jgi:hypothetical protein